MILKVYLKNDFVFKKPKNYKCPQIQITTKGALVNSLVKSNLLQIVFSLPADSLILPGLLQSTEILSLHLRGKEAQSWGGERGKVIQSRDSVALFSHSLSPRTHCGKPAGQITLNLTDLMLWKPPQFGNSTEMLLKLYRERQLRGTHLLAPLSQQTTNASVLYQGCDTGKTIASKGDTPCCGLGRPSLPWYLASSLGCR